VNGFAPLKAYALLGDLRATALVADDGAIDWLALPTLDSAPVCASLLDPARGGSITLAPTIPYEVQRRYLPDTMVLQTTYTTARGTVRLTDALCFGALGTLPWTELARLVEVQEGAVPLAWTVRPGHCLSADNRPWAHLRQQTPMLLIGEYQLGVVADGLGEPTIGDDQISGQVLARAGQSGLLAVVGTRAESLLVPRPEEIRERVAHTIDTWQHWSSLISYQGRWREEVLRSALALKALTLKSTGAIAGAATTSLPERVGGKRNFDYRFAWVRDASFALDAMSRIELSEELQAGVSWLLDAVSQEAPALRVFYDLNGAPTSGEMTDVQGAPGYRGSLPVHVGNSAATQSQLGAYGDLLDAVYHYTRHGGRLSIQDATMLGAMADHVCDIWTSSDAGIWELGSPEQYTSSKLGCWVALDRAVRLSDAGQITSPHAPRWHSEREHIRAWINEHCWSEAKRSYTFYAGSDELDAAVLLMARTGFCDPQDPRLGTTIDAILAELSEGPLVYRYSGQQDKEGAFLACSCWLVEALVHAGRIPEAEQLFTGFLQHANDVGLLTEEIDPGTGDLLGNIPQALTHLAVIGAATSLDTALSSLGTALS
jgi:GH15 family glucan-1,4-alpha-glucosidase